MPRWNAPKLTQAAVTAILVAATGAALMWLARAPAPERGARAPEPAPVPAAAAAIDAPDPLPAASEPAAPAAAARDAAAEADSNLVDAEPAEPEPPEPTLPEPAPPGRTTPWRTIDAETYSLTPATVPLYARLPGAYEWPLPTIDRLEIICFHRPDGPAHLSVMQAADGRLFHWREERRFLQEHLDAASIDSRDIRTVAAPGAFMEPLRAAAHAACERRRQDPNTPDGPE